MGKLGEAFHEFHAFYSAYHNAMPLLSSKREKSTIFLGILANGEGTFFSFKESQTIG